jgi:hypothetical protein
MSIAFASIADAIVKSMFSPETIEFRKSRMQALAKKFGGNASLGRLLGYRDGAYVGQMISGVRPITEKTIRLIEALRGCKDWFSSSGLVQTHLVREDHSHYGNMIKREIDLVNNPEYPAIRRVRFKLSAGASGFAVEYQDHEDVPMVFGSAWYVKNGLTPSKLFAVKVANGSMEPGLHDGDIVVVNTECDTPKDGRVFAVNYEGELVIKRLLRDAGEWWLSSDNLDQRRYPRKLCGEGVFLIGEIVHKQSERI